jgi:hypothetical protein
MRARPITFICVTVRVRRSAEDSGELLLDTSTPATDDDQAMAEERLMELIYASEKAKNDLGNDRATVQRLLDERIEQQAREVKPRDRTNR